MPNQSEPLSVMKLVLEYTLAQEYIVSLDLWPMAKWSCDPRDHVLRKWMLPVRRTES